MKDKHAHLLGYWRESRSIFKPGLSPLDIQSAEVKLGLPLPEEVRDIYLISNGVWPENDFMVRLWPLYEAVSEFITSPHSVDGFPSVIFMDYGIMDPFFSFLPDGRICSEQKIVADSLSEFGNILKFNPGALGIPVA
jgi:hypothetical protein